MSINVDGDSATKVTGLIVDTADPRYGTAPSATGVTAFPVTVGQRVQRVKVTFAALTAAATTQDITLWTTPAKTRVVRVIERLISNFTGGAISAMTVTCGNSAGGAQYVVSKSVLSGAPAQFGGVFADKGAALVDTTLADYSDTALTIQCRFTATSANVNAATAGEMDFYIVTESLP